MEEPLSTCSRWPAHCPLSLVSLAVFLLRGRVQSGWGGSFSPVTLWWGRLSQGAVGGWTEVQIVHSELREWGLYILLDESIKYQMRIKWTSPLCFTSHLSDGSSDDRTRTWREHWGPRLREWLPDVGPPHLQDGDSPGCAGDQGTFRQSKVLLQISSRSNKSRVFSNF